MFAAGGDMGVAFFMVLSGFVLSHGYHHRVAERRMSFGPFMLRRFRRLYPLHAATLAIFCGLALGGLWRPGGVLPLLTNAAMLQSWIPDPLYYFSGNAVSWCLADFMFFYAVFPWLMRALAHAPRRFAAAWAAAALLWVLALPAIPESLVTPVAYIMPLPRLLDFVLGMLLWQLYHSCPLTRALSQPAWRTAAQTLALLLCVAACLCWALLPPCYASAIWWWIPMGALILAFAVDDAAVATGGPLTRLLSFRGATFLGAISFPFYMTHWLAIKTWHHYAGATAAIPAWCALLIVFAAATAAALLLQRISNSNFGFRMTA